MSNIYNLDNKLETRHFITSVLAGGVGEALDYLDIRDFACGPDIIYLNSKYPQLRIALNHEDYTFDSEALYIPEYFFEEVDDMYQKNKNNLDKFVLYLDELSLRIRKYIIQEFNSLILDHYESINISEEYITWPYTSVGLKELNIKTLEVLFSLIIHNIQTKTLYNNFEIEDIVMHMLPNPDKDFYQRIEFTVCFEGNRYSAGVLTHRNREYTKKALFDVLNIGIFHEVRRVHQGGFND